MGQTSGQFGPGIRYEVFRYIQLRCCRPGPLTTKLYDRTTDELTLDEIEKIQI